MKLVSAILIAAGLALAGCFETPDTIDAASAEGGNESASASGSSASGSTNKEQAASTTQGASTARVVPFSEEGRTMNAVFVCALITCQSTSLPIGGEGASWFTPDLQGALEGAELTLTWTAETPATAELVLGIAYQKGGEPDFVYARGSSPLVLSEGALGIPAKDIDGVYVSAYQCTGAPPVIECTSFEQAFTLEGTLTTSSA